MSDTDSNSAVSERLEPCPCPWHGDSDDLDLNDNGAGCFWVVCNKTGCGCEGPYGQSADEAWAKWNRRTPTRTAVLEEAAARIEQYKDLDGSTGDEYDNGYIEAHNDALAAIRSLSTQEPRQSKGEG